MKAQIFVVGTGAFVSSAKRLHDRGEMGLEDYSAILRRSKELNEPILMMPSYVKEAVLNAEKTRQMLINRGVL